MDAGVTCHIGETERASAENAGGLLRREGNVIAVAATEALYVAHPALLQEFGEAGRAHCHRDIQHTIDHLATALELGDADIFARYVHWLVALLRVRNVAVSDIARSFHLVATECEGRFPPDEARLAKRVLAHGLAVLV